MLARKEDMKGWVRNDKYRKSIVLYSNFGYFKFMHGII